MKKIIALLLIATMVLAVTACGNKAEENVQKTEETAAVTEAVKETAEEAVKETVTETQRTAEESEDGRKQATEYTFTVKADDQLIENMTFSEDVTIEGADGAVNFQNCKFEKNIINKGTANTIARFMPGNEFAASSQAVISSGIKEATIETNFPKMMFFCEPLEATVENAGAIVTLADFPVKMNGKTYAIGDSNMFMDDTTGTFEEYSGQESTMHNICTWIEGGETKDMQIAIYVNME